MSYLVCSCIKDSNFFPSKFQLVLFSWPAIPFSILFTIWSLFFSLFLYLLYFQRFGNVASVGISEQSESKRRAITPLGTELLPDCSRLTTPPLQSARTHDGSACYQSASWRSWRACGKTNRLPPSRHGKYAITPHRTLTRMDSSWKSEERICVYVYK